jgi:hypothetical protein
LQAWVHNPRVLQLLREAAWALKAGRLTEQQLAAALSQQAKVRSETMPSFPVAFSQHCCGACVLVMVPAEDAGRCT